MIPTDEQLVFNYLKGDEKSLETLIKRYLKPIYSFAFRFIGNRQEAEDITQEIFVKVWQNLKKFDKKKSFKNWIFTIAKNTCLDWQKKKKTLPLFETIKNSISFSIENLEKKEVIFNFQKAVENLSPKYRQILLLRYNDDLTFRQIAEILKESINTLKSRHRRAINLLKKFLSSDTRK